MHQRKRVRVDGEDPDGLLGLCIVETLAAAEGVDPAELGICLHDYVDVSALVDLFGPGGRRPRRGSVSFVVEEWLVVVDVGRHEEMEVTVEPAQSGGTRSGHPVRSRERQGE